MTLARKGCKKDQDKKEGGGAGAPP